MPITTPIPQAFAGPILDHLRRIGALPFPPHEHVWRHEPPELGVRFTEMWCCAVCGRSRQAVLRALIATTIRETLCCRHGCTDRARYIAEFTGHPGRDGTPELSRGPVCGLHAHQHLWTQPIRVLGGFDPVGAARGRLEASSPRPVDRA